MTRTHKRPKIAHYVPSPNYSSRNGSAIRAVAIHTTEGQSASGAAFWFKNPLSQASSHNIVDRNGDLYQCVPESFKAWTILNLNPITLNLELAGFSSQTAKEWTVIWERQLKSAAKLTAYWCRTYGIPIRRARVRNIAGQPVILRKGIIGHVDLTRAGFGSHVDPGPGFPWARFLELVAYYDREGWVA